MLKNIFLPEKINDYYVFNKRIVGISISPLHVNATQLSLKGRSCIIEKCIQEPLDLDTTLSLTDRVGTTLKKIKAQLDRYDELHTVISSNGVVFKELKLPFQNRTQIELIINFEVEPLLPFAAKDGIIDFIITKHISEEHSAEVLVAATQNRLIAEHISLFEQIGMKPNIITVDMFALYGLYQQIPSYTKNTGSCALIGLDLNTTHLAHIYHNQLRAIRTISKGLSSIITSASDQTRMSYQDVFDHFIRWGVAESDNFDLTEALKNATTSFLNDIRFTLNTFASQAIQGEVIHSLLLFGEGAIIRELPTFIHNALLIPTSLFTLQELIDSHTITVTNNVPITSTQLISISAALPSPITNNFNLLKEEFSPTITSLLIKQLGIALVLSLALFTFLLTYTILDTKKIETRELTDRQESIELLQTRFPKAIDEDEQNLEDAVSKAKEALKNEENTWRAFSGQSRGSLLNSLLELTKAIDKKALGLIIDTLTITHDTITLKAKVNDYPALKALERDLKQVPLFSYVEPQTSPLFSMRITLAQTGEKKP